jgi:dTDP-4-dehydrorhamnose 3,5-epimerase
MSCFTVTDLPLAGLKLLGRMHVGDTRGFLSRLFCAEQLAASGWVKPIAQINHTCTSRRGAVRGLHFQRLPHSEMKLVSCIRGEVWDVAVDVRVSSETYLQWHAERLSGENGRAVLIPEGFAHGFQTLSDDVEMLYCHTASYAPEAEAGLNPLDAGLAINWPMVITELSVRDAGHPLIATGFEGVLL